MADLPEYIGKYKIIAEVAHGGMGIVYRAIHPSLKRQVIIKKLSMRGNQAVKERFKREAQILLDLHNPNIVHLFDYFVEGSFDYIVLEYVDGMSLDKLLKKQILLPPEVAMLIFRDSLRALKFAHDNGVVHRDIKPGNILISRHADIKLADFGIATTDREKDDTLTESGVTLGTPSYMPPEQFADSKTVDKRADIYAMGIMLYEMITGAKPYIGGFAPETIVKIQKGRYIPPKKINKSLPSVVCKLIKKMTRVKPSRRYQDIEPILKITEKYLSKYDTGEIKNSIEQSLVTKNYEFPAFVERYKKLKKFCATVLLALFLGGTGYALWQNGLVHKYVLRHWFTPVNLSIIVPESASQNADLPIKAFFFVNDNDKIPEVKNSNRIFVHSEKGYKAKPVYLRPGEYRIKVVTGSYVWWQSITVEKEDCNLNLSFLQNETRPLVIHTVAYDSTTNKKIPADFKFFVNGKWILASELQPNKLKSGSVVRVQASLPGYQTEIFSLLIEWYQDELFVNAKLKKE